MRHLALLLLVGVSALAAGQPPSIAPGKRIRVETQPPPSRVVGTLLSQTEDSLFIAYGNASHAIGSSTITRISASGGKSRSKGFTRGLKIGSLVGGGLVLVVFGGGYLAESRRADQLPILAGWVFAGALTGGVYGSVIGTAMGAEKWHTVYTRAAPASGFGLSLRM